MKQSGIISFFQNRIYLLAGSIAAIVVILLSFGFFVSQKEATGKKAAQALYEAQFNWDSLGEAEKISKMEKVYQDYHGSRAAFEAMLSVAAIHEKSNKLKEAVGAYEKALGEAPSAFDSILMHYALGVAQERLGDCTLAISHYDKALSRKEIGFLKGEILLGKARCHEILKEYAKALSVYQSVQEAYKQSYYADVARTLENKLRNEKKI